MGELEDVVTCVMLTLAAIYLAILVATWHAMRRWGPGMVLLLLLPAVGTYALLGPSVTKPLVMLWLVPTLGLLYVLRHAPPVKPPEDLPGTYYEIPDDDER